ncbi:Protein sex-lethal [Amphibalanus amphitrite]|uniref:Protein sex-lethal n=1 Tax=Amphibalanus amphitrite TaxID=1232801 RepID=A0A6A4W0W2_AMPAM|nr:Protein sex-lethal [Amphibalanus amphitrite]
MANSQACWHLWGPSLKCRIMRNVQTNYSYGYGFVEYVNPEDADRAIEQLNGLQVQNKKIKVSYARPPGQDIKDTNLYIQNLPRNIDESYLDGLFSPYGKIVQRRLLLDKYTSCREASDSSAIACAPRHRRPSPG